ncbi:hypothetical protein RRG08_034652 [Elysia crispata]|uniref:Uncharacterized protein n=1 Tax=Elysia crispata TaxID=231223 RepID=A0AAE1B392_9GAST|nr:hypothetical protein RRG08_034652 [Elysia crispata]
MLSKLRTCNYFLSDERRLLVKANWSSHHRYPAFADDKRICASQHKGADLYPKVTISKQLIIQCGAQEEDYRGIRPCDCHLVITKIISDPELPESLLIRIDVLPNMLSLFTPATKSIFWSTNIATLYPEQCTSLVLKPINGAGVCEYTWTIDWVHKINQHGSANSHSDMDLACIRPLVEPICEETKQFQSQLQVAGSFSKGQSHFTAGLYCPVILCSGLLMTYTGHRFTS